MLEEKAEIFEKSKKFLKMSILPLYANLPQNK